MDDIETILYASPKRENDIDDIEIIPYVSPKRENDIDDREAVAPQEGKAKMKLTKKYIRNQNLKLQFRLKNKQQREREKNLSKINWNKTKLIFKFQENLILKKFRTFLTMPKMKNH